MLRILLADDHKILREGIRRGLEGAGETVVGEASNGEEAVELARTTQPDVVLMDLSMPVMDGTEATRRITEAQPDTAVLVLTTFADDRHVMAAIDAGADVVMVTLNATEQAERAVIVEAESRGVGVLIKKALASGHLGRLKATPVEALKQILMVPGVHSAIVGTSSPAHLKENTTGIL